jgi:hypothetical protein
MTAAGSAEPRKNAAVTIVGLSTLLLGGAYAVLGSFLIVAGAGWAIQAEADPWGPVVTLLGFIPAFLLVIGIASLSLGIFGVLAGFGVLLRRAWGRVFAFIQAVLGILCGLAFLSAYDQGAALIALGAPQVLYGILALVVLVKDRAEFSRARA